MPTFANMLTCYYLAACLFTLLLFFLDKRAAKAKSWRVPERTLLLFCAAGGALGGWIGMMLFRHKTKHRKFTGTVPVFLLLHAALVVLLWCTGLIS